MLIGKKINLRMIEDKDIPVLLPLMNDLDSRGEYSSVHLHHESKIRKTYSDAGFWENDFGRLLITDKLDRILGAITFFKGACDNEGYEIGYQIYSKEDRKQGYASEALKIFIAYLFDLKPIERLQVCTVKENVASRKTAEKCGFVFEGTMRKAYFARGKYHDLNLFSLMREEYEALRVTGV